MSAWDDYYGGGKGTALSSTVGGRDYGGVGAALPSSNSGGLYQPTLPSGGRPALQSDEQDPGVISINPLDPGATSTDPISQLFNGLRQAIIGGNEETPGGEASREHSFAGKTPILGPLLGGVANVIGGAGEVAGAVIDTVGGGLERAGVPDVDGLNEQFEAAKDEAMQTENGREMLSSLQEAIDKERGVFGTGLLDDDGHLKSEFLRAWRKEAAFKDPSLSPGAFTAPGSLSDMVTNLFDVLEVSAAVAGKHWAGMGTPGQEGMNRLEAIKAVGDGEIAFNEDKGILGTGILAGDPTTGLNDMEQLVYTKVKNGDWTDDEALDFLASNGQAFGHSALANVGGAVAF
nr:hypothetical protein [Gemmatimonadota bacterium]